MMHPESGETTSSVQQGSLPKTSLIICTRNRPELLSELVASILDGKAVPTELIIIDDSDSPHESLEKLITYRPCKIRYRWNQSVGLSRANNTGVAVAQYDLLVFTQDDVLVSPTWFGSIVKALIKAGPRSVVTGRVLPGEPETPDGFAPSTVADEEPVIYKGRIGKDVLYAQNMAIYRSAIEAVGGFDPELGPGTVFPTAEDNDFGFRLLEAGYQILYEPQAVTYHRAWRDHDDYFPTCWNYGRGQGAYYAKYLSLRDPHMLGRLTWDAGYMALRSFARLWYKQKRAVGDLVYLTGLLSGAIQWLLTRHRRLTT